MQTTAFTTTHPYPAPESPVLRKIVAGIIGGAGYTGGELIRLLLHHPHARLQFIHSRSQAGLPVTSVHQDLVGDTTLTFTDQLDTEVDVLFLCAGHGEARSFLTENPLPQSIKIIDLSHDFRLKDAATLGNRTFVYGLPEINKSKIEQAQNIANPGCFATAIQLGLLPLASLGLLGEVHTTGITGSTGAGQGLSQSSHFSWRANNIQAYKTLSHQHLAEINQSLVQMGAQPVDLNFIPWRGDFTRGIFISSMLTCSLELPELLPHYQAFYHQAPFTHVSDQQIFLKQVVNTNKCIIHLEKVGTKLVVHSAVDNLLKGASGQAVQNMNLMFGLDETAGLQLKPSAF